MFANLVEHIMTNTNQFGGETRVCQYIVDSNATKMICTFDINGSIRKKWNQMAKK